MSSSTDHEERNAAPEGAGAGERTTRADGAPRADDAGAAERFETIRQLAGSGELEFPPEAEEIVGALLDTVAQRDRNQELLLRAVADHQNYQRRAANNEREAREMAVRGVVSALIPLVDQFEMAMSQDASRATVESMLAGVGMIRDEFLRVLGGYGVSQIRPEIGDEFNPGDHEAMMQQPAEGVAPGRVSFVMSTGYRLGDRVVRPAKVGVAPEATEGA